MPAARVGLVLGAGGVAGVAFHSGVLAALEETLGWDARSADLIVGTSAGSVTAAGLRAGLGSGDLFARTCGAALSAEGASIVARSDAVSQPSDGAFAPRLPSGMPAAPGVLMAAARRPLRVRPGAVFAGLLPPGTVSTGSISTGIDALFSHGWPHEPTWICAVRLDDGKLTVFGRPGTPPVRMGQAAASSCAIPGFFTPVEIDGSRYVDGGAHSLTNLAEVHDQDLDLVVVSAPMARAGARRRGLAGMARELNRMQLSREALRVRNRGTEVVIIAPSGDDQRAMGRNPMDRSRQEPIARQARQSTLSRLQRPDVSLRLRLLTELTQ